MSVGQRHPLDTLRPNCLHCGYTRCARHSNLPCSFCGDEDQISLREDTISRALERAKSANEGLVKADAERLALAASNEEDDACRWMSLEEHERLIAAAQQQKREERVESRKIDLQSVLFKGK